MISQSSALLAIMMNSLIYSVFRFVKLILVHINQKQNCYVEQTSTWGGISAVAYFYLCQQTWILKGFTGVK